MPSINLDQPLLQPIDPLSAPRVTAAKSGPASSFDNHFQRLAPPVENRPRKESQSAQTPPAPAPASAPQTSRREPSNDGARSEPSTDQPNGADKPAAVDDRETSTPPTPANAAVQPAQVVANQPADKKPKQTKPVPAAIRGLKGNKLAAAKSLVDRGLLPSREPTKPTGPTSPQPNQPTVKTKPTDEAQPSTEPVSSTANVAAATTIEDVPVTTATAEQAPVAQSDSQAAVTIEAVTAAAPDAKPSAASQENSESAAKQEVDPISAVATAEKDTHIDRPNPSNGPSTGANVKKAAANVPSDDAPVVLPSAGEERSAQASAADASVVDDAPRADAKPAQSVNASPVDQAPSAGPDSANPSSAALGPSGDTSHATGSSTARATTRGASGGSNVDLERVRLAQRVSRALQTAADGNGSLRLRLSPPELGSVRVEVTIKDGTLTARMEAETPAAKAALMDSYADLRSRLAEHDITLDRFEVELAERNDLGSGGEQSAGDAYADRDPSSSSPRPKASKAREVEEPAQSSRSDALVSADQLNVVI